ncbi:MAG: MFS transporter [Clostridiales bacterium]|jgi:UMF1 family MFS transporter|nr:MFS transporter [Clostridiales bacterium]
MRKNAVKTGRKSRYSWYFYDFGNSAYASVVLLAVYSSFFKNVVVGGTEGTRLWGISVGIAAVLVAVISPILGTIADFTKFKKKFLLIFTAISVVFTALLFFVGEGDIFTGMFFFIMAEIGYRAAQVFYDSLLSDVSTPDTIGSVSGKGWAIGMVGGIVSLLIVLLPIQLVGNHMIPIAFLITAAIYLISSIPTFLWVVEKREAEQIPGRKHIVATAFRKLAQTFRSVNSYKEFIRYTVAFLIYNDGIMMLMDFAAIIGATLFGMNQTQLIVFVILIQFSGTFGALLFGRISDKKSSKESIIISLLILIVSVACLLFIQDLILFYVIGVVAGFSLSGVQAVSRTMVSQLSPPEKSAEFYGFLSVAGRTSTFVGPLVFGSISFRASNWYVNHGYDPVPAEHYGLLWAVASIIAFLVIGMLVLFTVKRVRAKDPVKF